MLHMILKREGLVINHKRTERIYREEGLALRRRKRRRRQAHVRGSYPKSTAPEQSWSMDFMSDSLWRGSRFRLLNIVDDFSRECLAIEVDTSLGGFRVARLLDRLAMAHKLPDVITVDNGPEFTSKVMDHWAFKNGVKLNFIEPGKPVQNAIVESFNGRVREECLNGNWFTSLEEARRILEEWRLDYNQTRPHSSLGHLPPWEFLEKYKKEMAV